MMKSILLVLALPFILISSAVSVSACWCRKEAITTEKEFRRAIAKEVAKSSVVFLGEIIEQKRSQIRIKVERVWKGKIGPEIILTTHNWSDGDVGSIDSCTYDFTAGRRYLIYAEKSRGELVTSQCSRTQPADKADRDIAELDRSRTKKQVTRGKL